MIIALSTILLDGNLTGSVIRVPIMGSRNSSGAYKVKVEYWETSKFNSLINLLSRKSTVPQIKTHQFVVVVQPVA